MAIMLDAASRPRTDLPNPFLLESAPFGASKPCQLFLLHDGGGTIYSYSGLGALGRKTWGIHNPRFFEGGFYDGGLYEMAKLYAAMIRETVGSGEILLGGWSLGGMLSQEVAAELATREGEWRIFVKGIVMIDSMYTRLTEAERDSVAPHHVPFPAHTQTIIRDMVRGCMLSGGRMLPGWVPPSLREADKRSVKIAVPEEERYKVVPIVLIRCQDRAPLLDPQLAPRKMARVDVHRDWRKLGWEKDPVINIVRVLEIPGHHYNVFEESKYRVITRLLAQACNILDPKQT